MQTLNAVYLRRKQKVVLESGISALPEAYLATALKNLESLGFTFSLPLIRQVRTLSPESFIAFYKETAANLKEMVGAHKQFKPMYPNFPEEVMNMSEIELYINAIVHYITLDLPEREAQERFPLLDRNDLKVIDLGSEEDFDRAIRNLIGAKTSISETDKADIDWAISARPNVEALLPGEIPLKENVGFVVSSLLKHEKASAERVAPYFKTATDVLRLAAALSGGDVSLAANTKFRSFKRAERRLLLALLAQCGSITEDMLRYKGQWKRLGKHLQPGEHKKRYPQVIEAFDVIRNDMPFQTFGGRVEAALLEKDIPVLITLLQRRPGVFARRLDHMLRISASKALIVESFREVAAEVSSPVLLQVMAHFANRSQPVAARAFFPKGNVSKLVVVENTLPAIAETVCSPVADICRQVLSARFSALPSLGKVYIDEKLKSCLVPFSQRSASKALRTIVRGSKLAMPLGDTIRFFVWWKEGEVAGNHTGRVDIDLNAVLYGDSWNFMGDISFRNLRSDKFKGAHSGDITSAPNGACEFIDLDIPSVLSHGGRYVVMSVNSYTGQNFTELPECFAGWMMRQHPKSGEIFEPSTVADKIDLTSDTQISLPMILDLQERVVIWADLGLTRNPGFANAVRENERSVALMGKTISELKKPTLYDLFSLHAAGRADALVRSAEAADTVFSIESGITPFDIEKIMAEFM